MSLAARADGALRTRTIEWASPQPFRAELAGLSGLQMLEGIKAGRLPPPPMARVVGFAIGEVEPGRVVFELEPREDLENLAGMLHGGVAATLLDNALGAAVHTVVEHGQGVVTLDLKVSYLRPISLRSGLVRAEGRVLHHGRQTAYAEGDVRDARGALCAHAVGNFAIRG
ncbi:PaaI family thioesterase [Phenylobacterium sp.]|uniref:PaaI family thioesterase n=1 Tax=Phenylobacterium sp. TaxID=1871053 RepID=UPI0035B4AC4C